MSTSKLENTQSVKVDLQIQLKSILQACEQANALLSLLDADKVGEFMDIVYDLRASTTAAIDSLEDHQ